MKVEYDTLNKSIQIKDGLKQTYFILKVLMILNLGNALIRLTGQDTYGVIEYIWIVIGIASLVVLYFFIFKISTAEKIPIDTIKSLKEKSVLGRRRFSFELTDGKKRHLGNFKSEHELAKLRELVQIAGIHH
jgi:hypothetical protein